MTNTTLDLLSNFSCRIPSNRRVLFGVKVLIIVYTIYLLLTKEFISLKLRNSGIQQTVSSKNAGDGKLSFENRKAINGEENMVVLSSDKHDEETDKIINDDGESLTVLVAGNSSLVQNRLNDSTEELKKKFKEFLLSYSMMAVNDDFQYQINYFDELITAVANTNDGEIKLIQVNAAFLSVTYNLLCSMKRTKMDNGVLLWAMDAISFDTMRGYGYPVYFDPSLPASLEFERYHYGDYNKLMRARLRIFHRIVHLGIKFWFIDADLAVQKNFEHLSTTNYSMLIQTDLAFKKKNSLGYIPLACAGFFFMNNNSGSRYITTKWLKLSEEERQLEDQESLNLIIRSQQVQVKDGPLRNSNLVKSHIKFLPRRQFFNGHMLKYMNNVMMEDLRSAYILHVNGYSDKKTQLSKYNL